MKNGHKIAALGCLAVLVGSIACWRWMIRIPLKKFTRYALYMVVMDDAICRNKPEGNQTEDTVIVFPPRRESLQERYHLFWEMNRSKTRQQFQAEITDMEQLSSCCGARRASAIASSRSLA